MLTRQFPLLTIWGFDFELKEQEPGLKTCRWGSFVAIIGGLAVEKRSQA